MFAKGLSLSAIFLLGANLVPLFGVLFYAWDVGLVLGLFWIENLIIGGFNLFKMLIVADREKVFKGFFLSGFFVLHYGLFCVGHGLFMWDILDLGKLNEELSPFYHSDFGGLGFIVADFGGLFGEGITLVFNFIELYKPAIYLAILALFVSHIVRFIENFIVRGGILKETADKLMVRPYSQIIIMHVGLLAGGLLAEKFGSPIWLLVALVVFKLVVDVHHLQRRHKDQHKEIIKDI